VVRERPIPDRAAVPPKREGGRHRRHGTHGGGVRPLRRYVERRSDAATRRSERNRWRRSLPTVCVRISQATGPRCRGPHAVARHETCPAPRGVASRSDTGGAREQHALVMRAADRAGRSSRCCSSVRSDAVLRASPRAGCRFRRALQGVVSGPRAAERRRPADARLTRSLLLDASWRPDTTCCTAAQENDARQARSYFVAADAPREVRRSIRWMLAAALLFWIPADRRVHRRRQTSGDRRGVSSAE
jgi:hypothetical protein